MRLSNTALASLPADVVRPTYERSLVQPGIVHLGVGAFHRAHQAVMTDAVLANGDLRWGIVGAGLMTSSTKDALAAQDCLYCLVERSAEAETVRIVGSILQLFGGAADLTCVLQQMAAPSTRIVSLTVTEKGYYLDVATGQLLLNAPMVAADLAKPHEPKTILGLIVQALRLRRASGVPPFTVLSCDNLPNNGKTAKAAVVAFAERLDSELANWIKGEVRFPSSMVDRITPATTDTDRAYVDAQLGLQDAWPIMTESFVQWVIEDDFSLGRPDWTLGGAVFSNEIEAWEAMKLRCLNGAHSTLAYMGQLTSCDTVADAMNQPLISTLLDDFWAEVLQVLHAPSGVDTKDYVQQLKQRFRNPALKHRTLQIAMDGSQKLPQRILVSLRERLARGLPCPALATAIAGWMHLVVKVAHTPGSTLNDPLADVILSKARISLKSNEIVGELLSIQKIFGTDLATNTSFVSALILAFERLALHPEVATVAPITIPPITHGASL